MVLALGVLAAVAMNSLSIALYLFVMVAFISGVEICVLAWHHFIHRWMRSFKSWPCVTRGSDHKSAESNAKR